MKNILNSTGHKLVYENFVKAENCSLFDTEGNQYLELESGVWCTSLGHCHPQISEVIAAQSREMMHSGYCYLNPLIDETAAKILRITGIDSGKCVFLCSGSEAVEYAVKMVKSFTHKPYFLTLKNSYLSAYGISGEKSQEQWVEFDWMNSQQIDSIDYKNIAAFVFEPGSASGHVQFPPKELIKTIVQRVKEQEGIIITNEITTGIGRTGKWFGYNHYDLIPDIVAIGKGLGNGYPVSCTAISDEIIQKYDCASFHYSQSHQNDPLGARVANKVIEIIENENLLHRSEELGDLIMNRFMRCKEKYPCIKEVRGRGLMIAVEFVEHDECSYSEIVNHELLKKNIILVRRPGLEILRIDPALTITRNDVEYFLSSFEEILKGLY